MTESHPLPSIAKTAVSLLMQNFRRDLDALGVQTREAMGLPDDPKWAVNFDLGVITREIPDPPTPDEPPAQ